MTKESIRRRKELRFKKRIYRVHGAITEDNVDTYPVGNPYSKPISGQQKAAMIAFRNRRRQLERERMGEEAYQAFVKQINEDAERYRKEDEAADKIRKLKTAKRKVQRLFFK